MKKITSIFIMALSILIVFSSCGKENKTIESQNKDISVTKKNTNQTEIVEASEVVDITNKSGEVVTNSDGTKATTVVSVTKSVSKEEAKKIAEQKTLKSKSATNNVTSEITYIINTSTHKYHKDTCSYAKNISNDNKINFTGTLSELIKKYPNYEPCEYCLKTSQKTAKSSDIAVKSPTTTKVPATTKAPATTTQAPAITVASNPYKYKNAWGTLEQMETDCANHVATKNNFTYEYRLYVGYGSWSAPGRDCYGAPSASAFKTKVFEDIDALCREYYNECGYNTIRAVFLTKDTYKNKVAPEYQAKIGSYLIYDDEIMVVYVQSNASASF